jgi:hypothetical protein
MAKGIFARTFLMHCFKTFLLVFYPGWPIGSNLAYTWASWPIGSGQREESEPRPHCPNEVPAPPNQTIATCKLTPDQLAPCREDRESAGNELVHQNAWGTGKKGSEAWGESWPGPINDDRCKMRRNWTSLARLEPGASRVFIWAAGTTRMIPGPGKCFPVS